MNNSLRSLSLVAALAAATCAFAAEAAPKKVLVFTKSSGFIHDAIKTDGAPNHGYAFRELTALGARDNIQFTFSKDGSLFSPDYLAQFDAFLFYTTGDLTMERSDPRGDGNPPMSAAGKQALLDAITHGKGFVGVHSASDTFHNAENITPGPARYINDGDKTDAYAKMLGSSFIQHGAQQTTHLTVADASFPGASAVPPDFGPMEEWYSLKDFAPDLHVILVQETKDMKGPPYARPAYPETWARMQGQGRVFYTSMGHREDVWTNAVFKSLLQGGLDWALHRVEADVTPNFVQVTPHATELPKYVAPAPTKKKNSGDKK